MPEIDGTAATLIVGVISALVVVLAAKIKSSSDREQSAGPDWQRFNDNVQSWTERQLKERDKKISTLQDDVRTLQASLGESESKRHALMSHVHDWRAAYPDRASWPEIPQILRDDLAT